MKSSNAIFILNKETGDMYKAISEESLGGFYKFLINNLDLDKYSINYIIGTEYYETIEE